MKITLNGKETEITAQSVADLIKELKINPKATVIEYNGNVLPPGESQKLKDGDRLELVAFVGGG